MKRPAVDGQDSSGQSGNEYELLVVQGDGEANVSVFSGSSSEDEESFQGCRLLGAHLLNHRWWTWLVVAMITLNTLSMAFQTDLPEWKGWHFVERTFMAFFLFEMSFRIFVHRLRFFTDHNERSWNVFELVIVVAGCVDAVLEWLLPNPNDARGVLTLRVLRLFRLLRAIRLIKHFRQLKLLIDGFAHSMQAVFWVMVLFFLIILIAGIICTTIVGQHAYLWKKGPADIEDDDEETIQRQFGTLSSSMVTMFQMVALDDWCRLTRLVGKRMPMMIIFFVVYVLTTAFAMIALLTGVMTEHMNQVSQKSEEVEQEEEFKNTISALEAAFHKADLNSDKGLSLQEIAELLKAKPEIVDMMESGKMDDVTDIFHCLDVSGDGRVSWEEFLQGMAAIRCPAEERRVALMRAEVGHMQAMVADVLGAAGAGRDRGPAAGGPQLERRLGELEEQVRAMEVSLQRIVDAVGL